MRGVRLRLMVAVLVGAMGCGDDSAGADGGRDASVGDAAADAARDAAGDGSRDGGGDDSGSDASIDASVDGATDADDVDAAGDGGSPDTSGDGGTCRPEVVSFPMGGSLTPGTLCDELYACADDAEDVARIMAASAMFECTMGSEPASGCTVFTCSYRDPSGPSTLDEAEIAEICRVTLLEPAPTMTCAVFL